MCYAPLHDVPCTAVRAAIRLAKEAGADMVKLDGASDFPDAVHAIARTGIPVFAQFGITPQTALRHGIAYSAASKPGAQASAEATSRLVQEAKQLYVDAIAAARRFIYIENQYLTAHSVGDAMEKSLRAEHGPEIVIVSPNGR